MNLDLESRWNDPNSMAATCEAIQALLSATIDHERDEQSKRTLDHPGAIANHRKKSEVGPRSPAQTYPASLATRP